MRTERRQELHIDVGDEVVISCGQSVITMKKDGTIKIEGKDITIDAMSKIEREGTEHHLGGTCQERDEGGHGRRRGIGREHNQGQLGEDKLKEDDDRRRVRLKHNDYKIAADEAVTCHCKFCVLQGCRQFRPPRIMPRTTVRGIPVGVGRSGEEIWCDEYGCSKVQFHWGRYGKKDENCWIRVATPRTGTSWGERCDDAHRPRGHRRFPGG